MPNTTILRNQIKVVAHAAHETNAQNCSVGENNSSKVKTKSYKYLECPVSSRAWTFITISSLEEKIGNLIKYVPRFFCCSRSNLRRLTCRVLQKRKQHLFKATLCVVCAYRRIVLDWICDLGHSGSCAVFLDRN